MDAKSILLDLQNELQGSLLQEVFEIRSRQFEMRLLNEQETGWTFSLLNARNEISLALSARLAQLSVGIRSINGIPVDEVVQSEWDALEPLARGELLKENSGDVHFAHCALFLRWLSKQPPEFVNELHEAWQRLENRRAEAQREIKNSSGEGLAKEEKPS